MKKILVIIIVLATLFLLTKNNYDLTKDAIRFRVIANSNSTKDIIMKQKVVNSLKKIVFKENNTKEETRNNIINNISNIENSIEDLFKTNDYNETYNISYGLNYFPKKEYNGETFDEGEYESLVVEIGEAKGNNYWCILYPPLCMVDEEYEPSKTKYKFKIYEIIKGLF